MGRKIGLRVNPKKFALVDKPCTKELVSFLGCVALNQDDDKKCDKQKGLLQTCINEQVCFSPKSTILNFIQDTDTNKVFIFRKRNPRKNQQLTITYKG